MLALGINTLVGLHVKMLLLTSYTFCLLAVPTQTKAKLSQHQVSELMRQRWGFSLQVRPSTVDHPDAGRHMLSLPSEVPGTAISVCPIG
jgi:hypothetical protein